MISLALHGLALLIPLSEKEEVAEEPEVAASPEPITVTTLPKPADGDLPNAPAAISTIDPALPSALPPPSLVPQRAVPSPSEVSPPDLPSDLILTNPSLPAESGPVASAPTTTPAPTTVPPTDFAITQRLYTDTGATFNDEIKKGGEFAVRYGRPKDIRPVLELIYFAQGNCFDKDTKLEASAGIVVDDQGGLVDSELLKTTGYPVIDDWLTSYISLAEPLPDEVFMQLQQTIPAAPASGDLLDWLNAARNSSDPLVAADQDQAPYAFKVAVELDGNQCNLP